MLVIAQKYYNNAGYSLIKVISGYLLIKGDMHMKYSYIILEWVNLEKDRLDDRYSSNCVAHYAVDTEGVYEILCGIAERRGIDIKTMKGRDDIGFITTIHKIADSSVKMIYDIPLPI